MYKVYWVKVSARKAKNRKITHFRTKSVPNALQISKVLPMSQVLGQCKISFHLLQYFQAFFVCIILKWHVLTCAVLALRLATTTNFAPWKMRLKFLIKNKQTNMLTCLFVCFLLEILTSFFKGQNLWLLLISAQELHKSVHVILRWYRQKKLENIEANEMKFYIDLELETWVAPLRFVMH